MMVTGTDVTAKIYLSDILPPPSPKCLVVNILLLGKISLVNNFLVMSIN